MRASRENSSSTFSPDRAETSTATGMFDFEAQRDASSADTSRPSVATVAVILEPKPAPVDDRTEPLPPESKGKPDCLLETLDGVCGGLDRSSAGIPFGCDGNSL